jgi:hypothetical protein
MNGTLVSKKTVFIGIFVSVGVGIFLGVVIFPQLIRGIHVGYDICIQDNYAFVSNNDGVVIYDITTPRNTRRISKITINDGAGGIVLDNDLAYIAGDSEGLIIVNISDIENPRIISSTRLTHGAYKLRVDESFAYISMHGSGFNIVNISDPTSPCKVGSYLATGGLGNDIAIKGSYAYYSVPESGLKVVDITDPSAPQLIRTVSNTRGAWDIHIHGNMLYLSCHWMGVRIIDISNPASPSVVSTYTKPSGEAYGVYGNATFINVADLQQGTYSLNITDPLRPQEIAHNTNAAPHDVWSGYQNVFLADQDRELIILDSNLNILYTAY